MIPDNFFKTDQQYGKGFKLENYNGTFSLTSCQEGKDGGVYPEWVILQGTDRKPRMKENGQYMVIPMKVVLGKSAEEAISSLQNMVGMLKGESAQGQGQPQQQQYGPGPANYQKPNDHGQTYQNQKQTPPPGRFEDNIPF